jgi:hypothetical protein
VYWADGGRASSTPAKHPQRARSIGARIAPHRRSGWVGPSQPMVCVSGMCCRRRRSDHPCRRSSQATSGPSGPRDQQAHPASTGRWWRRCERSRQGSQRVMRGDADPTRPGELRRPALLAFLCCQIAGGRVHLIRVEVGRGGSPGGGLIGSSRKPGHEAALEHGQSRNHSSCHLMPVGADAGRPEGSDDAPPHSPRPVDDGRVVTRPILWGCLWLAGRGCWSWPTARPCGCASPRWMVHCHIAEHMQGGMMFSFTVARQ